MSLCNANSEDGRSEEEMKQNNLMDNEVKL
jgi:hypothetical protein